MRACVFTRFTACRVQTTHARGSLSAAEARKHFGENGVDGYVDLLAGREVLHTDRARLDVTVTGDQCDRGARAVRRRASRPLTPRSP